MTIIVMILINNNNNKNSKKKKNFFVPSKVGLYNCSLESESKSEMQTFELMATVKGNKNNRKELFK